MKNLKFCKEDHSYFLGGKRLTSVSQRVRETFPTFPRYAIARNCARKRGCSMQTVLDEWNEKSRKALFKGSVVHQYACDRIMGRKVNCHGRFTGYKKGVDEFLKTNSERICGSEVIVCDEETAGTIDVVCCENGTFSLMDFKTSKEIVRDNPYNDEKVRIGNCVVEDANYWKYSLQLSWYAKLFPFKVDDVFIVHVFDGGYEKIRGKLFTGL